MKIARHESILKDRSKVALFDFDGTLADTVKAHEQARHGAMEELLSSDVRVLLTSELQADAHRHGSHPHEIIGWLLSEVGYNDENLLNEIVTRKKALYEQLASEGLPEIAGSVAFLGFALTNYRDATIVTTASESEVSPFLRQNSISIDREKIVTGDMTGGDRELYKPHPFLYAKAIELLGILPNEAFAIEDSPRGIQSARSAGIPHVIGVETTHMDSELRIAGATEVYANYTDIKGQAQ